MKGRIKRLEIRLTEPEWKELQGKAEGYQSVSAMLRSAVRLLDNETAARRFERTKELISLYKKNDRNFSLVGSNLNQAVRTINEFSKVGLLTDSLVKDLLPQRLAELASIVAVLQQELRQLVNFATRPIV